MLISEGPGSNQYGGLLNLLADGLMERNYKVNFIVPRVEDTPSLPGTEEVTSITLSEFFL